MTFEGPLAVTVSINQHCDHQHSNCLKLLLKQTTHGYVKASVEAALIAAYKQLVNGKTVDP